MSEETLILIKPEGVKKKLVGEIISRFERAGLELAGLKMVLPTEELVETHYALTDEWVSGLAKKTRESFAKKGIEIQETDLEIAKRVQGWLKTHLKSGMIVAMVLRGEKAVEAVRKLVGATEPKSAAPGTIRGDYSTDSYAAADREKRCLRNIIHASGTVEEARKEIGIWFKSKTVYF